MKSSWNDDEDRALQGLSPDAQIIYLRGLRRHMDYRTGIVGQGKRLIIEKGLAEVIDFMGDRGSTKKRPPVTRQYIRSRLAELRRAGLIEDEDVRPGRRGYVFRLILADRDESVQKMNNRRTTAEQPHEQPLEQPQKTQQKQRAIELEQPYEHNQDDWSTNGRATTHPVSGNRKDITPSLRSGVSDDAGEYPPEFESTWQAYPPRDGGNPKPRAFKAWTARRKSGHSVEEMHQGTLRYAKWCAASGKTRTEYVMQAATFFGKDLRFAEPWAANGSPTNGQRKPADDDFDAKTYTGTPLEEIEWLR